MSSKDCETGVILRTLAKIVPSFYGVYYGVSACFVAGFGLKFEGTIPFDFNRFDPGVSGVSVGIDFFFFFFFSKLIFLF